jgi:ABC-type transporter Mla MlaB component
MNLEITEGPTYQRFNLEDNEGWTADNFFSELDRLFSSITTAVEKVAKDVVVDLSRVRHVDSSIITLLVHTIRILGDRTLSVITPNRETSSLLSLMGINRLAELYDSEEDWRNRTESGE